MDMKRFSKYNAPLNCALLLTFFLVPSMLALGWMFLVVPRLSAEFAQLAETRHYTGSILQSLNVGFVFPLFFVTQFLMIHFYQKYYDRKKRQQEPSTNAE